MAFAELDDFMDNQVKFYSSGMLVRLAVAVHVDPEVLLIDEVLAVGDESFQRRCLDRIRRFQADGRTIVLVTHALDVVRDVCDEAVMLEHGLLHTIGTPDDVVRTMRHRMLSDDPTFVPEQEPRSGDLRVAIESEGGLRDAVRPGEGLTITVDLRADAARPRRGRFVRGRLGHRPTIPSSRGRRPSWASVSARSTARSGSGSGSRRLRG